MHVAAQAPIAIDESGIKKEILNKELEIIKEELKNSGKKTDMIEKIANGKIKKVYFRQYTIKSSLDNGYKNESKRCFKKIFKNNQIKVLDFVRFKVGEGIRLIMPNFDKNEFSKNE